MHYEKANIQLVRECDQSTKYIGAAFIPETGEIKQNKLKKEKEKRITRKFPHLYS